jgi:hypothetical protein
MLNTWLGHCPEHGLRPVYLLEKVGADPRHDRLGSSQWGISMSMMDKWLGKHRRVSFSGWVYSVHGWKGLVPLEDYEKWKLAKLVKIGHLWECEKELVVVSSGNIDAVSGWIYEGHLWEVISPLGKWNTRYGGDVNLGCLVVDLSMSISRACELMKGPWECFGRVWCHESGIGFGRSILRVLDVLMEIQRPESSE